MSDREWREGGKSLDQIEDDLEARYGYRLDLETRRYSTPSMVVPDVNKADPHIVREDRAGFLERTEPRAASSPSLSGRGTGATHGGHARGQPIGLEKHSLKSDGGNQTRTQNEVQDVGSAQETALEGSQREDMLANLGQVHEVQFQKADNTADDAPLACVTVLQLNALMRSNEELSARPLDLVNHRTSECR